MSPKVHPRACGGNLLGYHYPRERRGASPRLRGKRFHLGPVCLGHGCIPAPAGETSEQPFVRLRKAVHPRACGGNSEPTAGTRWWSGASPRLRGKPPSKPSGRYLTGCIPAPAGETSYASNRYDCDRVHPRACGGNCPGGPRSPWSPGASPRLRGKRLAGRYRPEHSGCIPAPAGETEGHRGQQEAGRVHPRACGGNVSHRIQQAGKGGASPRLRGKPAQVAPDGTGLRCIPAPAGETRKARARGRLCRVHPRACGGNGWFAPERALAYGASPRLRGKLIEAERGVVRYRCIPAPAGETSRRR